MNRLIQVGVTALALLALGCSSPPAAAPAQDPGDCCHAPASAPDLGAEAAPLPADSVLQLEAGWTDAEGHALHLSDLRGEVWITAMIFTHCEYACPRILADLQAIDAALPSDARPRVRYLLASFDHVRDKPDVLRAYAAERGLDARWRLMWGEADAVRELAAALGVKYKPVEGGGFAHSNLVTVLDREGRIAAQIEGLGVSPDAAVRAALAALDAGSEKPER